MNATELFKNLHPSVKTLNFKVIDKNEEGKTVTLLEDVEASEDYQPIKIEVALEQEQFDKATLNQAVKATRANGYQFIEPKPKAAKVKGSSPLNANGLKY